MSPRKKTNLLTHQEQQVLEMMVEGLTPAKTAKRLGLKASTVYNIRYRIRCKTNLWSDAALGVWAAGRTR